ncbi:FAD-dependent oxidoreductase [Geomonas subterranea]|uniref:FAD-dependent oxidoreductase n=1 Tax=Geomonas subterranea TaxID=2847989 RepID=A0ABX8LFB5_9BACT|nr:MULTISPECIES: FAD-dependent oxidoreductase [Geomonas]QXE89350.1 FAD-dependent oxidoreductase [Geomonas subterranea]QXM08535.1 FAD-dependent oxidoreductase [Geomonas subterranea]
MAEVVFSSWGRNVVDNRKGGEKKEVSFKLPATYDGERPLSAFIGWDGIILYNKDVDIPAMVAEYMKRVQTKYVCGKCTPGKKGTRVIMDALSGIMEGRGKEEDLDTILDVGSVLSHCKCTLCPSSAVPVIDAVTHFRDAFVNYIRGAKSLSSEFRYIEKYTAPCMDKCPAHIDIPAYIESVKDYRFGDSLETIRESMPLPSVCGRVCPHPCETACRRKNVDEPINIMVLKRSASDYEWQHGHLPPMAPKAKQSKKVAVVGAGPAGLAAAYYLALEGYPVTIYEALPLGGGMVAVGIPPYRQPRHLLQRDIDIIQGLGVEIIYNTRVGKDITLDELRQKFDSVLLAPGAHRSKPMGVEGEDKGYKGFLTGGIDFLRNVYLGLPTGMGKKVFVVGGGNTAIDCVRVALREGAEESVLVYRRSRNEMPADVWEVDGADEEGVRFEFQVLPTKVIANDQNEVTGVELIRMALGEPDASGRRRPEPVPGSEFIIECDTIIPAIGQDADLSFIPADAGIDTTKWSTIVTKYVPLKGHDGKDLKDGMGNMLSRTLITDCDGVFASGDAEIGPLTVVACVGNGHRAAKVIQRYLEGKGVDLTDDERMEDILTYFGVYDKNEDVQWLDSASREHQKEVHGRERASYKNYCEVELGYGNSQAVREAERCLRCYRVAMVAV